MQYLSFSVCFLVKFKKIKLKPPYAQFIIYGKIKYEYSIILEFSFVRLKLFFPSYYSYIITE